MARLIYIRAGEWWKRARGRSGGLRKRFSRSDRDAILAPEPGIFSIVGTYTTYLPTIRLPPKGGIAICISRNRRRRDWLVTEPPWLSNKFPPSPPWRSRAYGDNDPHRERDWFDGSSVELWPSRCRSCITCNKFAISFHCALRRRSTTGGISRTLERIRLSFPRVGVLVSLPSSYLLKEELDSLLRAFLYTIADMPGILKALGSELTHILMINEIIGRKLPFQCYFTRLKLNNDYSLYNTCLTQIVCTRLFYFFISFKMYNNWFLFDEPNFQISM